MKEKHLIFGRSLVFILIFLAWVVNAILRVYFGYLTISGVQLLDNPVDSSVLSILVTMFLFLGVAGLVVSIGLWTKKRWGYVGTVFLIFATIVFDVWGMTIQFTAALGFIVPIVVLTYLVMSRSPIFGARIQSPVRA